MNLARLCRIALSASLLLVLTSCGHAAEPAVAVLHVDKAHPAAADDNPGTEDEPLLSLSAGLARALALRKAGRATDILVHPGTYRESLVQKFDNFGGPTIAFKATEAGKAILSGSDVWQEWTCRAGICKHGWPYDWGEAPNPWAEDANIAPLGLRREMVFIDGVPLSQRLSHEEMSNEPGSFYVDEAEDSIFLHLSPETDPDSMLVEIAERPQLLRLQGLNNLTFEGLVFQHANSPLPDTAVDIVDQRDITMSNVLVQYNNWDGLGLSGTRLTVRNSRMLHNGGNGVSGFRAQDLLLEDNETSYNNWRGAAGGLTGWAVGQKFFLTRNLTIRRHVSTHNLTRGLWLDTDNVGATLEEIYACDNLTDGIFLEANPGPIDIIGGTFCDNGQYGVLTSATQKLSLTGNRIENNQQGQLAVLGELDIKVVDWVTGQPHMLHNSHWALSDNRIAGHDRQLILTTSLPVLYWQRLLETSVFEDNLYVYENPDSARVFQVAGGERLSFSEWQRVTQQDKSSEAVAPEAP